MCIVIDANAAHRLNTSDKAGAAVLQWLLRGKGKLVVSNDLLKELSRTPVSSILVTLSQAGRLVRANEMLCQQTRKHLEERVEMKSNDHHVVSLVITSACELVFTEDRALHRDLKNRSIIGHHCSVYKTASHKHLLGECRC